LWRDAIVRDHPHSSASAVSGKPGRALSRIAAMLARQYGAPVGSWRLNQPSFSVYRQAATPSRLPLAGEQVLTRSDRLADLQRELGALAIHEIHHRGFVTPARVEPKEQP